MSGDASLNKAQPFSEIVEEVRREANPPKRPPGRPITHGKYSQKGNANAASPTQPSSSAPSGSPFSGTATNPGSPASGGAPTASTFISSGIPHEAIRNGLELPFAIAAGQTGFAGFALQKDESEKLVPMADHLLAKWLPTVGPYGVEMMFCGSIIALAGVKYMAFTEWKKLELQKMRSQQGGVHV